MIIVDLPNGPLTYPDQPQHTALGLQVTALGLQVCSALCVVVLVCYVLWCRWKQPKPQPQPPPPPPPAPAAAAPPPPPPLQTPPLPKPPPPHLAHLGAMLGNGGGGTGDAPHGHRLHQG